MLALYERGYLGQGDDGYARERVLDFKTLHALFVLDEEDRRAREEEDVDMKDPEHPLHYLTQDTVVEQWLRQLQPLVDNVRRDGDRTVDRNVTATLAQGHW